MARKMREKEELLKVQEKLLLIDNEFDSAESESSGVISTIDEDRAEQDQTSPKLPRSSNITTTAAFSLTIFTPQSPNPIL